MSRYRIVVESDQDPSFLEESIGSFVSANGGSVVSVTEEQDEEPTARPSDESQRSSVRPSSPSRSSGRDSDK